MKSDKIHWRYWVRSSERSWFGVTVRGCFPNMPLISASGSLWSLPGNVSIRLISRPYCLEIMIWYMGGGAKDLDVDCNILPGLGTTDVGEIQWGTGLLSLWKLRTGDVLRKCYRGWVNLATRSSQGVGKNQSWHQAFKREAGRTGMCSLKLWYLMVVDRDETVHFG